MGHPEAGRRLIVNADDFGKSAETNRAIIRAHREGILTSASLMVNEAGFAEAVELARAHPSLAVGLHLALVCGRGAGGPGAANPLLNSAGEFKDGPFLAGWNYYFKSGLEGALAQEIAAQFDKFKETGLPLDHVNGHLHLHLHPVIFRILMEGAGRWGITRLRLTRDPLWLNVRLAGGNWFYRLTRWLVYRMLAGKAEPELRKRGIRYTPWVFGLLQDSRVDRNYLRRLLPVLPAGDSELYAHPSLTDFKHELDALTDPGMKELVTGQRIRLIRYADL